MDATGAIIYALRLGVPAAPSFSTQFPLQPLLLASAPPRLLLPQLNFLSSLISAPPRLSVFFLSPCSFSSPRLSASAASSSQLGFVARMIFHRFRLQMSSTLTVTPVGTLWSTCSTMA